MLTKFVDLKDEIDLWGNAEYLYPPKRRAGIRGFRGKRGKRACLKNLTCKPA